MPQRKPLAGPDDDLGFIPDDDLGFVPDRASAPATRAGRPASPSSPSSPQVTPLNLAREYQLGTWEGLGLDTSGQKYLGTANLGPISVSADPAIGTAKNFIESLWPVQTYRAAEEALANPTLGNMAKAALTPLTAPLQSIAGILTAPFRSGAEFVEKSESDPLAAANAAGRTVSQIAQAAPIVKAGAQLARGAAPLAGQAANAGRTTVVNAIGAAPDSVLVKAIGIDPEYAGAALSELKQAPVKVRDVQTAKLAIADRKPFILRMYDILKSATENEIVPGSKDAMYRAEVRAIPEHVRMADPAKYDTLVHDLAMKYGRIQRDFTRGELDTFRSSKGAANTAAYRKKLSDAIANDESLKAMDLAVEDAARDLFYRALDEDGFGQGDLARQLNRRKAALIKLEDALKSAEKKSMIDAGKSKAGKVFDVAGSPLKETARIAKEALTGEYQSINKAIADAVNRWTGSPAQILRDTLRPVQVRGIPREKNPMDLTTHGTSFVPSSRPRIEPPRIDPITGQVIQRYQPPREK